MEIVKVVGLIIGGAVLLQVIGAVWYGPLFGKQWTRSMGKTLEEIKNTPTDKMRRMYGGSFAVGLIVSAFLYLLASSAMSNPITTPLMIGLSTLITTAVLAGAASLPSYLYEERSLAMWLIHYSYVALAYGLIATVFAMVA